MIFNIKDKNDQQQYKIYLDDAVETLSYEKQALEVKLQHNIQQLSSKNAYLTTILKQLLRKEVESTQRECQISKEIIKTCLLMEDQLASLQALEKKTEILKMQVIAVKSHLMTVQKDQSELKPPLVKIQEIDNKVGKQTNDK